MKDIKFPRIGSDGTKEFQKLANDKPKFIVRYNEIGCNTCVNLIFKRKGNLEKLLQKYEFVVLVDFNNYDDFLRWKRTSEMSDNIYWIEKNSLAFDKYFKNNSYSFILDKDMVAKNFFVPNNQFQELLIEYLDDLVVQ